MRDQDPIRIEEIELDPTRRGYTQIPNYFKHYWTPLIGYQAAAVYEMILSFAWGDKDTANPSLSRLAAHLKMSRNTLKGRKREESTLPVKMREKEERKEYDELGILDVLQEYGLLFVEITGEEPATQSYTFKILKNPPLLTPPQLSLLPRIIQEAHQKLLKKCELEREQLSLFFSSKKGRGGDARTTGVVTPGPLGGDARTTNKTNEEEQLNKTTTTRGEDGSPGENVPASNEVPVVVVPKPKKNRDAGAFSDVPALYFTSFLSDYETAIRRDLVPRFGIQLVQEYVDWLEFQYRKTPPRQPLSLLAVSLSRKNLIRPAGFKTREEREKEKGKEGSENGTVAVGQQMEENQARMSRARALFDELPPEEKADYLERASQGVPEFLRGGYLVESQAAMLCLEERGGDHGE